MRKFIRQTLTALFVAANLFIVSPVNAEVQTYEGTDEYIMNEAENLAVAKERAKEKALRNAREKAGVYIHSFSRTIDLELVEDEIISIVSGVLRVIEVHFDTTPLPEANGFTIRATVKANIDTADLEKWLYKDAEELSKIVEQDKELKRQEEVQEQKIEQLKQEYVRAETPEQKEVIVKQIADEDNAFMSNLKLREGNKFRDEGNFNRAAELFTEAIDINPKNVIAWNNRGWACVELKKYKEAMSDFDKAIELDPNIWYSYLGRGQVYFNQKKQPEAFAEYNKALRINPNNAVLWNNRGAARSWFNNWKDAVRDYTKAIELDPNYALAYQNRGNVYQLLGEMKKAREDFDRADKLRRSNKKDDKAINEADTLLKNGDYQGALALYNQAIEASPKNFNLYNRRGNIYGDNLNDYDKAIADFNKALELNPNADWIWCNRGNDYRKQKRYDLALSDCNKALELNPNYARAYNTRGLTYLDGFQNYTRAIQDFNKAIQVDPNFKYPYANLGRALTALKDYNQALANFDKAIQLDPNYGYAYWHRGKCFEAMGDAAKAQADFAKAKKLGFNC